MLTWALGHDFKKSNFFTCFIHVFVYCNIIGFIKWNLQIMNTIYITPFDRVNCGAAFPFFEIWINFYRLKLLMNSLFYFLFRRSLFIIYICCVCVCVCLSLYIYVYVYIYIEVQSKNKRIQKFGIFSLNSELEMLYKKGDL